MDFAVNDLAVAINQSLGIELQKTISITELKNKLANYIHHLINNDFNKLVSILYRIDVSEQKLKLLLEGNRSEDAGMIIAELIIERQQQKLQSREQFRKTGENSIDENEKW
jgi:hypothetical protein